MRTLLRLLVALFLPLLTHAEIVFSGYMGVAESPVFNLTDEATKTNAWVKLNQTFQGYTLSTFDVESKTLTLKKGADVLELRLSSAAPPPEPPTEDTVATAQPETEAEILALAVKLAEAGDQQISDMLASYQAATDPSVEPGQSPEARDSLKMQIIALVRERTQQSNESD